ncbi:MAG TPA: alpha/beta hydrolase-fold protein [Allosphingosinicella sp.]|nr:alpha/beta hydrolase-fold protein [Allosphingosinicella sp.]
MSRLHLLAAALAALLAPLPAAAAPYEVPRSEVRTMQAPSGGAYRIMIARPERPPPPGGYPVIYVLDGDDNFAIVAETAERFGRNPGFAPGIVVGIGYPGSSRRSFDYTPVSAEGGPRGEPTGGAAAFRAFLADTVRPAIERDFPIDRSRQAIIGHSFGGLFVLDTLFVRPDMFQVYIAASPSIWFGDRDVLNREAAFVRRMAQGDLHPILVLTVGSDEQEAPPWMSDPAERARAERRNGERRMVDNVTDLGARLTGVPGLSVHRRVLMGEHHGTSMLPAIGNGLTFIFAARRP